MAQFKAKLNPFTGTLQLVPTNIVLAFKAAVATQAALPLTENAMGDARIANDTGVLWVWSIDATSGLLTDWVSAGDIVDIDWSVITNKPTSSVANIDDAVSKRHTQNSDTKLAEGTANEVTAANAKDAVDKKHTQGTDQKLDDGGANEVSAAQAKAGYTHAGTTGNPHGTVASEIDTDESGKSVQDKIDDLTSGKQDALGFTPENVANKRTSFQVTPDDTHYPSEKLVKDSLDGKQNSLGYTPVPDTRTVNSKQLNVNIEIEASDIPTDASGKTVQDHIDDVANPHGVTKTQVGLSNVDNKSEATIITDVKADSDVADALSKKHAASGQFNQATAAEISGLTDKETPVDADVILGEDSAAGTAFSKIKITWSHIKATLKTYFDGIYQAALGYTAENSANKKTDLSDNSDTYYASQKAVKTAVDAKLDASKRKTGTFVNEDLSTGKLTITHNLGLSAPYSVIVVIFDNNAKQIIPDEITGLTNTTTVDLTSFGAISGTWGYLLLG